MDGDPLFDEILCFWADFEVQGFIEDLDVLEESPDSKDFLSGLELKVAEGHQTPSIIDCSFVVFDDTEFIEQFLHEFVGAFLRYIVDKHFLPDFVFGAHLI